MRAAGGLLRAVVGRGRRAGFVLGTHPTQTFRITSLEGDWDAAYAALAAVEADGELPLEQLARGPGREQGGGVVLVVASLTPQAVDRLLLHDLAGSAIVFVDATSFGAQRGRVSDPGLLRLAAAGVPVAVVRRGDDLARVLGDDVEGRASA